MTQTTEDIEFQRETWRITTAGKGTYIGVDILTKEAAFPTDIDLDDDNFLDAEDVIVPAGVYFAQGEDAIEPYDLYMDKGGLALLEYLDGAGALQSL